MGDWPQPCRNGLVSSTLGLVRWFGVTGRSATPAAMHQPVVTLRRQDGGMICNQKE